MKTVYHTFISRLLVFALVMGLSFCTKSKTDPQPALISPSDAKKVGDALIMPNGTQTKTGTPPAPSSSTQAPKVTPTTTDQPTSNGSTERVGVNYSNLNGGIGGAYAQVQGSLSYYDIPLSGNAPKSGVVTLPIGIPDNIDNGSFTLVVCIYDASGRVSNIISIRFTITRFTPPAPGKGSVVLNGKTYSATAVCDIDMGFGYGKAYGIMITSNQAILLYNLRPGNNQLVDIINGNFDATKDPWGAYIDSNGSFYASTSGSATYNGKVVSVSMRGEDFNGNKTSFTAAGNCQ
ncbi:hypothetical protein [Fibrella aquatilis]|uniref:Uncharacterized protein n=1 Tax=Fibrella aquatilis TaxID=2817059 RepID=A0A939G268_9BACT|nr:hypothetical protein [Fibrella aquatilis]MBO0930526.1 hypothetical protein [Fibrella aquatilis]